MAAQAIPELKSADTRIPGQLAFFRTLNEKKKVQGLIGKNSALIHQLAFTGIRTIQIDQGNLLDSRFGGFTGVVPGYRNITTDPVYRQIGVTMGSDGRLRFDIPDAPNVSDPQRRNQPWIPWSIQLLGRP